MTKLMLDVKRDSFFCFVANYLSPVTGQVGSELHSHFKIVLAVYGYCIKNDAIFMIIVSLIRSTWLSYHHIDSHLSNNHKFCLHYMVSILGNLTTWLYFVKWNRSVYTYITIHQIVNKLSFNNSLKQYIIKFFNLMMTFGIMCSSLNVESKTNYYGQAADVPDEGPIFSKHTLTCYVVEIGIYMKLASISVGKCIREIVLKCYILMEILRGKSSFFSF